MRLKNLKRKTDVIKINLLLDDVQACFSFRTTSDNLSLSTRVYHLPANTSYIIDQEESTGLPVRLRMSNA